jgi:hypothetical protein
MSGNATATPTGSAKTLNAANTVYHIHTHNTKTTERGCTASLCSFLKDTAGSLAQTLLGSQTTEPFMILQRIDRTGARLHDPVFISLSVEDADVIQTQSKLDRYSTDEDTGRLTTVCLGLETSKNIEIMDGIKKGLTAAGITVVYQTIDSAVIGHVGV